MASFFHTNKLDFPAPEGPIIASKLPGSKYPETEVKILLPPIQHSI
jgi:hypothetical protein